MAHELGHLGSGFDVGDLFLQDNPRASFFNAITPFNRSPSRQRFNESQFDTIFNRFLGQLGGQAQGGDLPTGMFNDFVNNIDFNREFFQSPSAIRGFGQARFSPRTRFLFGF